jgi:hypothetical protein
MERPREGDLIYFPLNRKVFEIKFVEHEPVFYQLGALQMYDLKCELFEYNNEKFDTGIAEIDALFYERSLDIERFAILLQTGGSLLREDGGILTTEGYDIQTIDTAAENEELQIESDLILDFTETNPFSEGGTY